MTELTVQRTNRVGSGAIDLDALKRKSWLGITAQSVRIAAPVAFDFKLSSSLNCVILYDLHRFDGETIVSGLPPSFAKDLRGKLAFIPAGCDFSGWNEIAKSASIVTVMIDPIAASPQPVDLTQLPPRLYFDDPMLRSLMLRFQAILDDPSLDVPGYAKMLCDLLTFELARVTSSQRPPLSSQSGLTPGQMRLITEYIDRKS